MKLKKITWLIISSIGSLITGIIIGDFILEKPFIKNFFLAPYNKIDVILDIVNKNYVDSIYMKDVIENTVTHIINKIDPYSIYISNKKLKQFNEDLEGYFGGIGIDYLIYKDTVVIVNIMQRSPALQAGLLPGDRIVYVNDSIFIGKNIKEERILKVLRGQIGSFLRIGIFRNTSKQAIEFCIKRKKTLLTTVKFAYEIENEIGFIKICNKITHTTYSEFMHAITKLLAFGCTSFVIDLRANKGGSYDSAIRIINEFLPVGKMIVYLEGKSFSRMTSISNGNGILKGNQVVILIDKTSASSSEIIAGSIQDNDRGLIVGQCSFGKGLIQNQIELSDGSAIRITVARYYTPSGRNIQREYELVRLAKCGEKWIGQFNNNKNCIRYDVKIKDTNIVYHTLHGRVVYGSCGIMPDIFIPVNASRLSSYYLNLEEKNIFNQFAFKYSDENRSILNQFEDYLSMLKYLKTKPILKDIVEFASNNEIKKRTSLIDYSADKILNTAYAYILRFHFGDEIFYLNCLSNDPVVTQAVWLLKKRYTF